MKQKIIDLWNFETKHSGIISFITLIILLFSLFYTFSSNSKSYEIETLRNHPVFSVRYGQTHLTDNEVEKNLIISANHSEVDNLSIEVIAVAKLSSKENDATVLIPIFDYYLPCKIIRDFSKSDIGFCNGNKNQYFDKQFKDSFEYLKFISIENYVSVTCTMKDQTNCDTYIRHNSYGDIRNESAKNTLKLLQHLIKKNLMIIRGYNPKKIEQNIISEYGL